MFAAREKDTSIVARSLLVWLCLASASPALADVFSYRDAQGNLHFVDQETAIPPQYRSATPGAGTPGLAGSPSRGGGVFNSAQPSSQEPPGAEGGPAEPPVATDETVEAGSPSCALRYVDKPTKDIDARYATVTYHGIVENTGNGLARGVRVHLKLFSALDGTQIDSSFGVVSPSNLDPRDRGTFEVKGYFRKQGLRNSSKDDLMLDYLRCDPSSHAEQPPTAASRCKVEIVGKPDKTVDTVAQTLTYVGTVQNRGEGTAKTVQVELTRFTLAEGRAMEPVYVNVVPGRLGPGESGAFTLVASREFGFRDTGKDKLKVRVASCE